MFGSHASTQKYNFKFKKDIPYLATEPWFPLWAIPRDLKNQS